MDMLVSGVKNAKATVCQNVDLIQMLDGIREGRWKPAVDEVRTSYRSGGKKKAGLLKKELKAIMFSGRFSRRNAKSLISYSSLIVADFDDLDIQPGGGIHQARTALVTSPHLFALFLSVTGSGLKALFRVPNDPNLHKESFKAVARHCRKLTGHEIDPSGSDVCRLCYVSFDPELFRNLKAIQLSLEDSPSTSELYREGESQREGVAESFSNGEAEKGRKRVVEDVTAGEPPTVLLPSIANPSLLTAAETAAMIAKHNLVPTGKHQTNGLMFRLARVGRSFEVSRKRALANEDLRVLFDSWHGTTHRLNPEFVWQPKSNYWVEFLSIFPATLFPIETDPLPMAWKLANHEKLPVEAEQFQDSPKMQKLIALCYQLGKFNVEGPGVFFLSGHSAAPLVGISHVTVISWLIGFVRLGILELIKKGEKSSPSGPGRKARNVAGRYRWIGLIAPINPTN